MEPNAGNSTAGNGIKFMKYEKNDFWNERTLWRSLPNQEHIEAMIAEAEEALNDEISGGECKASEDGTLSQ